jgi:8-oxo-dGTP pyrophosphatase MutT (NUDIX family)
MTDTPAPRRGGRQIVPRPEQWEPGPPPPFPTGFVPALHDVLAAVPAVDGPMLPAFPNARHSAVLIVLTDVGEGAEVLLTTRSWQLRNHKGEVSFPGGRMDPGETPTDTALREAWEEVGLDPSLVTIHGELEHLNTVVSRSYIVPKVATVPHRPPLTPHAAEVDRVFWLPLAELTRAGTYRSERWGTRPVDHVLHFFETDDETIWGATARMLVDLLERTTG